MCTRHSSARLLSNAVTLSHVIEHVLDPAGLLLEIHRILKTGGRLVITTPNFSSRGHSLFRDAWVHLDPPRHLYLFSPESLRRCCERAGFRVETLRTSDRIASWTWAASDAIRHKGVFRRETDMTPRRRIRGIAWLMETELPRNLPGKLEGEELVVIARPIAAPVEASDCVCESAHAETGSLPASV